MPQRLLNRRMFLLLVASLGGMSGFNVLLSVVPLYVAAGGEGGVGAGLTTGVMMLATVLTELAVPRLLDRFGCRALVAAGLVLLGVPAALLALSPSLPWTLAVCLARGAGLGIVVVAGTTLAAQLAPPGRRSESLGLYGVAIGVPPVVALPLGVSLSDSLGFAPVFLGTAALTLAALAAVPGLPGRAEAPAVEAVEAVPSGPAAPGPAAGGGGVLGGLKVPALARPTLILAAGTLVAGVVVTFLPLALIDADRNLVAAALLVQAATAPVARWCAGWYGDRFGSGRLLVPAVCAGAAGTAALAFPGAPWGVLVGMALFGAAYGVLQNVTLTVMFERVPRAAFGRVSALWNLAFDAGMGVGAVGFGVLIGWTGYSTGFALTAALLLAAVVPAWLDTRAGDRGPRPARHLSNPRSAAR
ncbi:MFS transporter [Streptomyces marincola]|uniref:MFS transporter n=1 Tax=Streptomyces marincola TaxID=2878388 RepID=UPI001CF38246|nr:MFS transporter [Streptomyces marincola]UCM88961.1 MFS transporter [Streptomyces marincola]